MVPRYDPNASPYAPSITVARYNEEASQSIQMGSVVARVGGKVGIRWDATYVGPYTGSQRFEYQVIPEAELEQMVRDAEEVFEEWAKQAAAEQYAEEGWLRAAENNFYYDDDPRWY